MFKTVIFTILLSLLFSSCSKHEEKPDPLVITIDPWIGSAIFYYAHAKGWLEEANIELILTPSIAENMRVYEAGASDMFTATQHEFFKERKKNPDLTPIILYDRSFGGDMVMSNKSSAELKNSTEPIELFLENDSVNEEMANYWIKDNNISQERVRIHARPQNEIAKIKPDERQMVVVTYSPHNTALEQSGFTEIASTKNDHYLVVDAIYMSKKLYEQNKPSLQLLNNAKKRAIKAYRENPKEFYKSIRPYFPNLGFDDFLQMTKKLQWIDNQASPKLSKRLQDASFPQELLLP